MLFNEPKLLKCFVSSSGSTPKYCFSALQRAEIAEIAGSVRTGARAVKVSVLFNEPKLLKSRRSDARLRGHPGNVSVLFNEPKLLKSN